MFRKNFPYIVGFFLLTFFCCWEYGPVLRHLAEESYFCTEELPMTYVLRLPFGKLYWVGRALMLPFHSQWIGGLYLALLLTFIAWCTDRALRIASNWKGVGFVLPALLMGYAAYRNYNIFMRNEPSKLILWVWGLLLLTAIAAGVTTLCTKKHESETYKWNRLRGMWIGAISLVVLCAGTYTFRQNLLLSCHMQNLLMEQDWEGMINDAQAARQPDRSVAAYHVIAITQMGQVLEHAFDLDYDYPTVKLDSIGGMDEGVNYIGECNLHAGLVYPAYHYAMEQLVMAGPRLRHFKMMAICSMLNNEKALCERYLHIIEKHPFQKSWTENIRAMLNDRDLIMADPMMANIMTLYPLEDKFEQNFRTPAFLGYSVGVLSGSDATLNVSVAAALYSKDLENIILRASYLQQKRTLPLCVQQALIIASFKRPGLLDRFPGINEFAKQEVQRFVGDAAPLVDDKSEEGRKKMKETLEKDWRGSYMYYYYCGNLKQTVQRKTETAVN